MELYKESESIINFNAIEDGLTVEDTLYSYNVSGRLFRKLNREKGILLNGKIAKKRVKVNKGDILTIVMEDESDNIAPQDIPLDIIYEDNDLLVLNKQPNVVVHPTKSHLDGTIANGVGKYFRQKGIKKKIRFANRLDMDTSGILIVAKNQFAHQQLGIEFENNSVEKKYLAVVEGIVKKDEDVIDLPVGREEESVKKAVTFEGKNAITRYKVIERYENASLLEVQIFTGRSHQIRVHLNYIGHPIIGDTLYNEPSNYINRQALHSYYLRIKHPRTNSCIEFNAPLPKDIEDLICKIKRP
jgi:23S rRNA pseudouridine1911/1915/1917 synthase